VEKTLSDVWDKLPDLPHTKKYFDEKTKLRIYEVCDRKFHETVKASNVLKTLKHVETVYGNRSRIAKETDFCDFKAFSHALKAAYQVKEILVDKNLTFPLKEAKFIKAVKEGKLHFEDEVKPVLNNLMDEIEIMTKNSDLPEQVDTSFWDSFLIDAVGSYLDCDMRSVNR